MKERIILLAMLMLTGCGKPEDPAPAKPERPDSVHQPEKTTAESQPNETNETNDPDNACAKGVVTLKTGRTVAGQILLQCPGYLTACFKIDSSKPEDSELVPWEEVQSVVLKERLSDVDPLWMKLHEEMTIIAPGP